MLHIILFILKLLGIVLLGILALLLLILCAVLFVSVTYRVRVEKKDSFQVSAAGGWLFRILSVHYSLDGADDWKQDLRIRVFGITVLNLFGEKKPKKRKKKRKKKAERPVDTAPAAGQAPDMLLPAAEDTAPAEEKIAQRSLPAVTERPREERRKKLSFAQRIRLFFLKLVYAIRGICGKIKGVGNGIRSAGKNLRRTVQSLRERKDVYLEFWNLEEHRRAREAIYKELRWLWKKSRPRKIEGQARFGLEDPSVTGMCMGALSVLYAWYPEKFQLCPDFEREILEGEVLIKGRVRLYVAALILWRVWFNKDIRHMYEHWQEL